MQLIILITAFWCIISCLHVSRIKGQECEANRDKEWSYEPSFSNGPSGWGNRYSDCNGNSQSPINIVTDDVSNANGNQKLKLRGYETPITKVRIENNGHTISITPQDGIRRSLELGSDKYTLDSFHFHWGNSSTKGSEHQINGRQYDMEAHFVHRNERGELAVVGVFFKENNRENKAMDTILEEMDNYLYEGESFDGALWQWLRWYRNINLEYLVDRRSDYYRYDGSLTTPPCTEGVKWLVCKPIKHVKRSQMKKLFSLYSVEKGTDNEKRCHLINNFRPLQPLNGRTVSG